MSMIMEKRDIANYDFLTKAPVSRVVITLAFPTILSMLTTSSYNIIDTYFVSLLGTKATVAVGISFVVMALLQAIGFLFGCGVGNYVAIRLGARDLKRAQLMTSIGLIFALSTGVIVTIIGLSLIDSLSFCLGGNQEIASVAKKYLRFILLSAPFIIGSFMLNQQLRMQGKAKVATIGIISGLLLNILLDPLFILGFKSDISGIGAATLISHAFSFFILLRLVFHSDCPPLTTGINLDFNYLRPIIIGGLPSFIRQLLGCITIFLLNLSATMYGEGAIAAITITTRITFVVVSIITGLAQGFQPLCGFCYGAGLYNRIKAAFKFTVFLGTVFLVGTMLFGLAFIPELFSIFTNDPDIIDLGSEALFYQMLVFPIETYIILASMLLQTMNYTSYATLIALVRKGILFIPLIVILPIAYGFRGVEICQPVCDIVTFVIAIPLVTKTFAKMKDGYFTSVLNKYSVVSQF